MMDSKAEIKRSNGSTRVSERQISNHSRTVMSVFSPMSASCDRISSTSLSIKTMSSSMYDASPPYSESLDSTARGKTHTQKDERKIRNQHEDCKIRDAANNETAYATLSKIIKSPQPAHGHTFVNVIRKLDLRIRAKQRENGEVDASLGLACVFPAHTRARKDE